VDDDQVQPDLREALKRGAVALKQAHVPFALMGSYALWAWGGPEPDHDVDFLVAQPDAGEAERALRDAGFRVEQPPEDWLFKAFLDDAMVDVILRSAGSAATREDLRGARALEVLSVEMPVLPPTELVVQKLSALNEHGCDFTVLLPAMRALREQVDWTEVARECGENDYAAALLFLLDRLGITRGGLETARTGSGPV
jgi:hypothetical protein